MGSVRKWKEEENEHQHRQFLRLLMGVIILDVMSTAKKRKSPETR